MSEHYPDAPGFVAGSDTSEAAAESMKPTAAARRQQVFNAIARTSLHGATCDEIERIEKLSHQTCSARFTELAAKSLIFDSGQRRVTRSGRKAAVWLVVPLQNRLPLA